MKAAGEDVIGFGVGEPDFDTPDNIKEAAIKAIKEGQTKYTPASGTMALKKAIAAKLKRENNLDYEPSQIVISNGGKHSLINTFMAILNEGDEVIIPAPYWVSYPEMVRIAGGIPVSLATHEKNNFKFTLSELKEAITPKTKAIVINSPSNPTGMVYNKKELQEIANLAVEKGFYVISDEIYENLIYNGEKVSIAGLGDKIKEQTILVNGLSKSYSMTGWRIGYTASNQKISKIMSNLQSHMTSNPSSISQAAAVEGLNGDQSSVDKMLKAFTERREYLVNALNEIDGVSVLSPDGAFYAFVNIKGVLKGRTSEEFCKELLQKQKMALVPSEGFGIEGYVRWSYATSMDMIKEGVKRLKTFLK